MGDHKVKLIANRAQLNSYTKSLLRDVYALERMLDEDWFNHDPIHIGAEQEIYLVDSHFKVAPKSDQLLPNLDPKIFTTELAKFNIEANLPPIIFSDDCFRDLERLLNETMGKLREEARKHHLEVIMAGILPTIRKFDLQIGNITPLDRYKALVQAINKMRGSDHELHISGLDELNIKNESAMIESCNTSFQVHIQVTPDEFVSKYNIAQVLAAPVLAVAVNSPMLFGKRLWAETRVALFQQSVDTRMVTNHIRDRSPRVMFGHEWLKGSITALYKEDIARFRVLLMSDTDEDVFQQLDQGITPALRALTIHNSTVYRWNRGCYGISPNGKPHLRIENRVLPAGPSIIDEVANAAFWAGLMNEFDREYPLITKKMEFDHAKRNFMSSARDGLNTDYTWIKKQKISVRELIKKELIPLARAGLERNNIPKADIDRYLGVIEERNESGKTGTQWLLDSNTKLMKKSSREEATIALTASMLAYQNTGKPIHKWNTASLKEIKGWKPHDMLVEEFMTTDLFTVQENDIPEFVVDILNWKNLKHIPVEDDSGKLLGLINYRILLKYYSKLKDTSPDKKMVVKDLMIKDPIVIEPEANIHQALALMKSKKVDCLPVVKNGKLCGIISEGNFLHFTTILLQGKERE